MIHYMMSVGKSHSGRHGHKYNKKKNDNQSRMQIAVVTAKAAVQAVMAERRDGDECTMCRGDETGMRPKLARPSPSYIFTDEVKSIYHTHKIEAENIHMVEKILDSQALIQAENKGDNKTVKSIQF